MVPLSEWCLCLNGAFFRMVPLSEWGLCPNGAFVRMMPLSKWCLCKCVWHNSMNHQSCWVQDNLF
jgi:hypothetical protein